ncbi:MAG: ORF6N domain-containing protein [Pedobacter sp.]
MNIVKFEAVEEYILTIRGVKVILDSDVAELYGVETRDINKAVKNNPDKFPDGYIIELDTNELDDLRCKFSTAKLSKTRVSPKAFTEKGLYMIATILKSPQATQTTIAIIETFLQRSRRFRAPSRH